MHPTCQRFVVDEEGATAIEYALIAALITLVILAAVTTFANNAVALFTTVATHVTAASP